MLAIPQSDNRVRLRPRFVSRKFAGLWEPHRFKVFYGGRGGAKSYSFADALLIQAAKTKLKILCAREIQKSITESVHALLEERINELGLKSVYEIQNTVIRGKNSSEFIFGGLRTNVNEIKSLQGVDRCWVEEAQAVSKQSWKVLLPTIRKAGSEIWISFNPNEESDPTYQAFVLNPPPGALVVKVGWEDNPLLDAEQIKAKDYMYAVDPESAANVWGGECLKISDAQILKGKYSVEAFTPLPDWFGPYFGGDFGFAKDPAVFVKCWISADRRFLYIEYEAYGHGIEINQLFNLFDGIPDAVLRVKQLPDGTVVRRDDRRAGEIVLAPQQYAIRCDSSRPETISYLANQGLGAIAAKKWSGSVEDGIAFLRQFEKIIIHPRCKETAQEARLYRYKVDKLTNDVLPIVVDANNHCIDGIRYALQPIISPDPEEAVVVFDASQYMPVNSLDEYDQLLGVINR